MNHPPRQHGRSQTHPRRGRHYFILCTRRGFHLPSIIKLNRHATGHGDGGTIKRTSDLILDYAAIHPNADIRYKASDMIFQIYSDASYLLELEAMSRASGGYILGWLLENCLKFVTLSAAKAELGALFINVKEGRGMGLALVEMCHPQPPASIHCNNATSVGIASVGIANNTVKKYRSRRWK